MGLAEHPVRLSVEGDKSPSRTSASSDTVDDPEVCNGEREEVEACPSAEKSNTTNQLTLTKSRASVNDTTSVPNGGLKAWLQVLGAFFLMFNSWGIINTFGAYQTYYSTPESIFVEPSSTISWIGSIQAFLLLLFGALTGPLYDAGHFRLLIVTGSFLVVFGHMMLSLCSTYWQALLAQAFCVGVGCGCLFVPGVAIISTYFTTKLPVAVGIAASGSSLGGVIYPIVFHRLQPTIGFAWATRVIGFIVLATQLLSASFMKMRVRPASKRALLDLEAFTEPAYLLFVLGGAVSFCGLYVPFFYIQSYAIGNHITNASIGFYLLAILNTGSVFGRILPNLLAQRTGPWNMLITCASATGILTLVLNGTHNLPGIVVVALLYGFFSGTLVSLPPTIFVGLSPNRGKIGTRMGQGFTLLGVGVLIGTPIAGAILGDPDKIPADQLNWTGVWVFGGVLTLSGAALFAAGRVYKAGWKVSLKV